MKRIFLMLISVVCALVAWWCGQVYFETGRGMFGVSGLIMAACALVAGMIMSPGKAPAPSSTGDHIDAQAKVTVPMRMLYYMTEDGQPQGPVTALALRDLWRRGLVTDETLTAMEGDEDWLPLATFQDLIFPVQTKRVVGAMSQKTSDSSVEGTRTFGRILVAIGAGIGIYFGLMFDTTVASDFGRSVHNVGLMNDRMVGFALAAVCFMSGLFLATRTGK